MATPVHLHEKNNINAVGQHSPLYFQKLQVLYKFMCIYIMQKKENVENDVSNAMYFLHFLCLLKEKLWVLGSHCHNLIFLI